MAMKRESSIKRMNRYVLEGPQSGAAAEEPPSDPALVMAGVCGWVGGWVCCVLCVCVRACVRACVRVLCRRLSAQTHTRTHARTHACTHTHTHTRTHAHTTHPGIAPSYDFTAVKAVRPGNLDDVKTADACVYELAKDDPREVRCSRGGVYVSCLHA